MPKPLSQTVGRRKTAVVRVRLVDGDGKVFVNGKKLEEYFPSMATRLRVLEPLRLVGVESRFDVHATAEGGGTTGQTDALRLGIARALIDNEPELRPQLKKAGFLTRDPRAVERKKYGLRKARRAPQYTKR